MELIKMLAFPYYISIINRGFSTFPPEVQLAYNMQKAGVRLRDAGER